MLRLSVIVGMHRGGTSVIARAVHALGINLGENLLPGSVSENPKGFWEDREVLSINERLLRLLGVSWYSLLIPDFDGRCSIAKLDDLKAEAISLVQARIQRFEKWGFKDPRTARLLPFWQHVFNELNISETYVIAVRNPINIAASLKRRNGFDELHSQLLSLSHMFDIIRKTKERPRVFVDYDAVIEDPINQLRRLATRLEIELTDTIEVQIAQFAREFVLDDLRHHQLTEDTSSLASKLLAPSREFYLALKALAHDKLIPKESGEIAKVITTASRTLNDMESVCICIDSLYARIERTNVELEHARAVVAERDAQLAQLNEQLPRLGTELEHARTVVAERDTELLRIKSHWAWRILRIKTN